MGSKKKVQRYPELNEKYNLIREEIKSMRETHGTPWLKLEEYFSTRNGGTQYLSASTIRRYYMEDYGNSTEGSLAGSIEEPLTEETSEVSRASVSSNDATWRSDVRKALRDTTIARCETVARLLEWYKTSDDLDEDLRLDILSSYVRRI